MENAFNERGVTVTRNGLSAAGQSFALRDILGVEVVTIQKDKVMPASISLVGAATAAAGAVYSSSAALVVGVMLVVVGYLTWKWQDVTYRLIIDTAAGKHEALSSVDLDFVDRVARVVRDAQAAAA
jgi:hypothetical protein